MNQFNRFAIVLGYTAWLGIVPVSARADQTVDYAALAQAATRLQNQPSCSYGQKVNEKGLRVLANLLISTPEISKGIINVTNDSNIFLGLTGGLLKGVINTVGRTGSGVIDLLTLLIPTKPIVYPLYAWENFDQDTSYGTLMHLDTCPEEAVVAVPVAAPPQPAVSTPPRPAVAPDVRRPQDSQKIDHLFQQRMHK